MRQPPTSTLFPYTTLFRSSAASSAFTRLTTARLEALPFLSTLMYRSEEHTSELQSLRHLVCRLLLEKKKHHEWHPKRIFDCLPNIYTWHYYHECRLTLKQS